MKQSLLLPALLAGCLCIACNNGPTLKKNTDLMPGQTTGLNDNKKDSRNKKDPAVQDPATPVSQDVRPVSNTTDAPKLLNDISMRVSGDIQVAQAYLIYGDNENLVPDGNETTINRPVNLLINLQKGWQQDGNGQVSIGAYEKIETNTGEVLLSSDDLFKDYPSVNAANANVIKLKAVITQLNKPVDYFVVSYRVWDKRGNGEIVGSYRLKIAQ